jgi:hypothetical protein
MGNVVSLVPDPEHGREPAEDVSTVALRAAQAAIGAVAIAMGAAAEIVREVAGLPEDDRPTPGQDRATLLAGAALGLASEAARTAAAFADAAVRASRPVVIAGSSVAAPLARIADDLLARWDATWQRERPDAEAMAGAVATEATRRGVDAVLDQLDLTAIVQERVDVDAIVASVDVDAIARRIDVDAIVARMDMDALTERIDVNAIADRIDVERLLDRLDLSAIALDVFDRIDLPEIIRASTGSVASDSMRGVRIGSQAADDAISRFVDRVLGRRRPGDGA